MLEERELLVRRREREVVACRQPTALLRPERRVRHDDVGLRQLLSRRGERVAELHVAVDAVEHQVHQGEAVRVLHELHAEECLCALEGLLSLLQVEQVVRLALDVAICRDEETARARRRILDELAGFGLHNVHDGVDERPRLLH